MQHKLKFKLYLNSIIVMVSKLKVK